MNRKLLFADIKPGLEYKTPGLVVTETHIVDFAGLSGDFFEVHMDDDFARSLASLAVLHMGFFALASWMG